MQETINGTPFAMARIFDPTATHRLLHRSSPERCQCGELLDTHDAALCPTCRVRLLRLEDSVTVQTAKMIYGSYADAMLEWGDDDVSTPADREASRIRALGD